MFKRVLLVALLAGPLAAWTFIKTVRVLVPEFAGVTCFERVCVDDLARFSEAKALSEEAVQFVQSSVGKLQAVPRMVFCATQECSRSFGVTSNGEYNVAKGWYSRQPSRLAFIFRAPLPEPLQGYRAQFEFWFKLVGAEHLWAEAERP